MGSRGSVRFAGRSGKVGAMAGRRLMRWRLYRDLLEQLPVFALIVGTDGRVLSINAHAAKLNGVAVSRVVGRRINELWPAGRDARQRATTTALRTGGAFTCDECWETLDGRGAIWLRTTRLPALGGILTVGEDVTEAVQLSAYSRLHGTPFRKMRIEPEASAVGALLLGGYDVTDIAVALHMPTSSVFGVLAHIAGVPCR